MRKIIYIVLAVLLIVGLGVGIYFYFNNKTSEQVVIGEVDDNNEVTKEDVVVKSDFYENFRDGKIDDFWKWNDNGNVDNTVNVDYTNEEMLINAAPVTAQWSNQDTAPILSFLTDKDFQFTVNFSFSPKVDFQHAGIGLVDKNDNNWIRMSRAYDSHALENSLDLADSVYVMEKNVMDGVKKYNHENFIDTNIFMRMTKKANLVSFEYSRDGIKWDKLDEVEKSNLSQETEVYLFVYSTEKIPAKAIFKEIQFNVI